jgi:hypothetical protein
MEIPDTALWSAELTLLTGVPKFRQRRYRAVLWLSHRRSSSLLGWRTSGDHIINL